jgi:hypothetical protein
MKIRAGAGPEDRISQRTPGNGDFLKIALENRATPGTITARLASARQLKSGCSSGVERNLAKVDVVSSNLITRSIFFL